MQQADGSGTPHICARSAHARKRAFERYGFEFDNKILAQLRHRIIQHMMEPSPDNGCVHLYRQSDELGHYALWYGAEWVPLVYDEVMRAIVTLLPKEYLRKHKEKLPW